MNNRGTRGKYLLNEAFVMKGDVRRLPLTISLLFFLTTSAWILFEHAYLQVWGFIAKDFFWAVMSTGVLFLLLYYGISAVRSSKAALVESEERLSRILETSTSGIIVVDQKGDYTYANLEAAELLGIHRSDLIGRNYRERPWEITTVDGRPYPEEDLPFSRVHREGITVYGVELSVRRQDGTRVIVLINTAPLLDPDGNIAGMVASFFDVTARREAEDLQLRKLRLAAEQSPIAIAITDKEGRIEYANPMFLRITGYPREALLDGVKPCPAEISPRECKQICDAIAAGTEWKGEYWNRRRNGELYWESAGLTPIRSAEGNVTNFLWVARDITEQRLADEALKESQERYQSLVEKIHDLVFEFDQDTAHTYVSPRVRDVLGYEPEEILGKTPFDLMPKFERERVAELVAPIIAGRRSFEHLETILRHKDGRYLVFTSSGVPFYAPDGSFRGWRGVARDISKLKRDEEALRQSEERFRQIFEQKEEPVFIFRAGSTEVLDANPAATSLYGYSLEEIKEGGLSLFVSPGEQFRLEQEIRGISPSAPLSVEEARHVRKDRTPIIVSLRGQSIQLQEGQVSYCTFRDITARVRAEEEARTRQAQLIHANRMTSLGTMVSGVAHEINNPNNLIMFNAPMIQAAWADADRVLASYFRESGEFSLGGLSYSEMRLVVPKLITGMTESSGRIRAIVEKLKNFARRDKEKLDCKIYLNEVVRAAVSILNHEIARGCRNFRLDLAENLPMVKGCAQQLEQVMVNLLMNSLQALPDRTKGIRVTTSVREETGMVEVRVIDEGVGISPELMSRLSEPFFSTKLDSGGLGLGLSISSSIVLEHNGSLDFTSEVGKGTTARVAFPPIDYAMESSPDLSVPNYSR
ncbi:MAG: PAS domain S-box protein [Deltaproteobacteria bacterium]|nr:PAS domain S-box protein [Deltaproteobacteria bacterium]